MVEAWAPIATLAQFEATLSRTFDLSGLAGRDGNESTLVPRISHADTDVRALVAALPRLVTRSDGQAADLVFDRTLGEGGMGIVRLAEQRALGREVAVKSLRADRATPEAALRLVREAWITGRLEHPNIVPVYTLGVDADGQPMIVMKRIEGTLWSDYLRGRAEPQTPAERRLEWHLRVLMQVANAVELAASKGIVHRDLKPDNVMIGRFGEVYVLDWGIAVSLDDRAAGRLPLASAAHGIAGTPAYMAPEMVEEDAARLGPRTDVYLLGATLHEVLVGAPRHGGRSIVECLFSSHHSAPFDYPAHVPVELAAIANRAMRRLPADRFESAEVFRRALEDFLSHETARALAAEATSRLAELERLLGDAERAAPRDPADAAIRAPDVPEVALYEVFGGCRFGFMQALRAWPDSPGARPGLERALRLMIEHELGRDNVGAAAALARQLQPPAPELDARIEATRARLDARAAKLAKLEADRNLDTGLRTRAFLSLVAAFSWAALPLGLAIAEQRTATPASYVHYLGGFSVLAAGLVWGTWWARDSLTRTAVNRQITASVWVLGLGLLLVVLAGLARGVPLEHTVPAQLVVLVVATFTIAIASDLRLALAAIFPAVAFVATLRSLEHALYWAAAAKFCSFLAAAIIWRPRTWAALTAPPPGRARWRRARAGRRL